MMPQLDERSTAEGIGESEKSCEGDVSPHNPERAFSASFADLPRADPDFLEERPTIIGDDGRFSQ